MKAPQSPQSIAEDVLGFIRWGSDTAGFTDCPGKAQHTNKDGAKDCRVMIDGVPTVYCMHDSCRAEVENANRALRKAFRAGCGNGFKKRRLTTAERKARRERKAEKAREEQLLSWARDNRDKILAQFAIEPQAFFAQSPVAIPESPLEQARMLLSLFDSEDIVWIGEKKTTGQPWHAFHFKMAKEWLAEERISGGLTCPSTFKAGSVSRCNENVLHRPFLVVESDTLTKRDTCAIFRWLEQRMPLHAIVDTGGKSLHGWFEYPGDKEAAELKIILPELGCDEGMFRSSQACRMPGAFRYDGLGVGFGPLQIQQLKYFNPKN